MPETVENLSANVTAQGKGQNSDFEAFGPNSGLVEEMYQQYLENPSSVGQGWVDFFADYKPRAQRDARSTSFPQVDNRKEERRSESPAPAQKAIKPIHANEDSTISAKLMEINRTIINNSLARHGGGKLSFTHLIAFAVALAVKKVPGMNVGYGEDENGKPTLITHQDLNLGLAVDVKKPNGSRSLVVPNIRNANNMTFQQFYSAYEEMIRKVKSNKLTADDFASTTATITNPGMIGTEHSVPRLMPGQGFILGAGSIAYPAEYGGADPETIAELGISKVLMLTSTYDHRVVQGALSGEFLKHVHELLIGQHNFYEDIFESLEIPYEAAKWNQDSRPEKSSIEMYEKVLNVYRLINQYRARGHLIADLDPLHRDKITTFEELDILHYGLSIWDLDRKFPTGGLGGKSSICIFIALNIKIGSKKNLRAHNMKQRSKKKEEYLKG